MSVNIDIIEFGELIINFSEQTVFFIEKEIEFTNREFQVLYFLAQHKGQWADVDPWV